MKKKIISDVTFDVLKVFKKLVVTRKTFFFIFSKPKKSMQIFIPFPCVRKSLKSLDYKRLGKQRLEAWQIIRIIRGETTGYQKHPIISTYRKYLPAVIDYYNKCLEEWENRGYQNDKLQPIKLDSEPERPPFWDYKEFTDRHQAILRAKDPLFYTVEKGFLAEPKESCFYIIDEEMVDYALPENRKSPKRKREPKKETPAKKVPMLDAILKKLKRNQ